MLQNSIGNMIISVIQIEMVFTRKKRQRNRSFLSQINKTADDFNVDNTGVDIQNTSVTDRKDDNVVSYNVNHLTSQNGSQVNKPTLKKNQWQGED